MKLVAYLLSAFLILFTLAPACGAEDQTREIKRPEALRNGSNEQRKYTFENYIADMKIATRNGELKPDRSIPASAAKRGQEYKPLNPVVIGW